jgi:cyclase
MIGAKMLAKRIIPCLDVRHGKVVKGVNFEGVKDVGDPILLAEEYNRQGADELVFYDIVASHEGRGAMLDVIRKTAEKVFIPFCVGGGVSSVDDFRTILRAGADKVSINSSAVKNPELISAAADIFGCQCVVLGVDTRRSPDTESGYTVFVNGGRIDMKIDLIEWVIKAEKSGAGEICLNSMDTDGVRGGFDLPMLKAVCEAVKIPVIASGGAGKLTDFGDAFEQTGCSAALAASLFHFGELTVSEVKENCRGRGILIR